jgi:ribosomal protein S27E
MEKHLFKTTFQNSLTQRLSCEDVRNRTVMNIFAHGVEQVKCKSLNLIPCGGTSPLAQDRDQSKALVNMVMNLEVP